MSVTREEAITNLEKLAALFYTESEQSKMVDYSKIIETLEFAAAVLRPVSRERIEKMWMGHWVKCKHADYYVCNKCSTVSKTGEDEFCKSCGAPMTDEAVQMVMERLEALKDGKGD